MSDINNRVEAMRRQDVKRMNLAELRDMAGKLHAAAAMFEDAAKYERTSAKHPAALEREVKAEELLDAAVLRFAQIRSRVQE